MVGVCMVGVCVVVGGACVVMGGACVGACMAGGCAWWWRVCMAEDVHGSRGHVWRGGMCAGEMATEAGGTHPTRMHSC